MKKSIPTYAERSAAYEARQVQPWERSMAEIIRANFDEIESDITSRKVPVADVVRYLEAERSDYFQAFLNESAEKARARLKRNPGNVEAARALEKVDHAAANPPFEPFKLGSFNSELHRVRKERRAAGTYNHRKPARTPGRLSRVSEVDDLKSFATSEETDASPAVAVDTACPRSSQQPVKSPLHGEPHVKASQKAKPGSEMAPAAEQPESGDLAAPNPASVDPDPAYPIPTSTVEQQVRPSENEPAAAVPAELTRPASSPEGGTPEAPDGPGASPLHVETPGRRGPVIATFIE